MSLNRYVESKEDVLYPLLDAVLRSHPTIVRLETGHQVTGFGEKMQILRPDLGPVRHRSARRGAGMLERDGYPAGVPCWVDTTQPDPEAAAGFYGSLFGWELEDRMPPGSAGHYFVARLRGRVVAAVGSRSEADAGAQAPVWNTYVCVDRADDAAAKVGDAGGRVLVGPFAVGDAGRMAVCSDPSGAVFRVWEPGTNKGAELVNEPGTWNWSDLNTRDVDGSKPSTVRSSAGRPPP